jgi:dipeptidyl aminopeptidase/acylaminoacyl peptidase
MIAGAGLTALAASLGGEALAQATPAPTVAKEPPLGAFYIPPATADFALSPSGKKIAVLHNRLGATSIESYVDIVDADNPNQPPQSVKLGGHEATAISWANDTRLLVWVIFDVATKYVAPESIVRVIAINIDGSNPAVLFGNRPETLEYIHNLGAVIDQLPDDPDNVLMEAWEPLRGLPALYKVNVNDGSATVLEYGELRTFNWITQNGRAMVRLDGERSGAMIHVMVRAPGESDWKFLHAYRADQALEFAIYCPTSRPGVFIGAGSQGDEDKISIREINLADMSMGPPMLTPATVDASGVWLDDKRTLAGMHWREDRIAYQFTDKSFAPHYAACQKYFGPDLEVEMEAVDATATRYLAVASGPQEPGIFFFYDRKTHAIVELGRAQPHLTPDRLGKMIPLKVKARDGAEIHAYLTQPISGAPGPLVVMPHGGPELRDYWGYDVWAQSLAAKGWWVLQPNFRGSGGYGSAYAVAGWKHWGDRMQEDVDDAIAMAIEQYKLDASRVAILGGSYGGYAALMGAVRRPEFYKAVVSIAGVSDLPDMLAWEKSEDDTPQKEMLGFWRKRIGDPEADAAMLIKASPRRRAAEIKAPVLLIHGTADGTVPVAQSRDMAKALTAAGKSVDYWEIKRAGHSAATRVADRERMERAIGFIEKALA